MEQEIIVIILVAIIVYLIYSIKNTGLVHAEFDGQIYMVQEHKDKIGKSMIGKKGGFTGCKHTQEYKDNIRNFNKDNKYHLDHKHTLETKNIMSIKRKEWYAKGNECYNKGKKLSIETINKIISHRPMNKLEELVSNILKSNNISFIHQFYINNGNICKSFDFKIGNILLEIDGDYYHGGPGCKKHFFKLEEVKENDLVKNDLAKERGYQIIRIWESKIKENNNIIIQKLNECL